MKLAIHIQQALVDNAKEAKKRAKKGLKFLEDNAEEISRVEEGLECVKQWFIKSNLDTTNRCIDISFAGDKHVLEGVFGALRKLGYEPSSRPKDEKMTSFTCWFDKDGTPLRLWLTFSSTVCKRVKVGTKMVEQDVYEIVCE